MASKRRRLNDDAVTAPANSPSSVAPRRKVPKVEDVPDAVMRNKARVIQSAMPQVPVHDVLLALQVRQGQVDEAIDLLKNGSIRSASLIRLPQELVDRVCDFLPERDTLLMLRATCRDLAAKTTKKFGEAYWRVSQWCLDPSGWRKFNSYSNSNDNLHSYTNTLSLVAPHVCHTYASYTLAKGWGTGDVLAQNCLNLQNLRTLNLLYFKFEGSKAFLHNFCTRLRSPSMCHLSIEGMKVEDVDLAALIKNHKKNLHNVVLDRVDVYGGWNEFVQDLLDDGRPKVADRVKTPWTRVFKALMQLKGDECTIKLETPMDHGAEVDFLDWEDDLSVFEEGHPCTEFWGTTVHMVMDDPTDEDSDMHYEIVVRSSKNWRRGVRRLQHLYERGIYDPDREGTPPWLDDCSDIVDFEVSQIRAGSASSDVTAAESQAAEEEVNHNHTQAAGSAAIDNPADAGNDQTASGPELKEHPDGEDDEHNRKHSAPKQTPQSSERNESSSTPTTTPNLPRSSRIKSLQ